MGAVANLYRKYVQTGVKKLDLDTDMQKEYNRQRDYLEKSVDSLKRKLEKDSQAHRIDNMRIMQENVSLIREINDLRREINALKHERTAQELQAINQQGVSDKESPPWAQQADRELTMQREELEALKRHLADLEMNQPRAPSAGGRLAQGTLPTVNSDTTLPPQGLVLQHGAPGAGGMPQVGAPVQPHQEPLAEPQVEPQADFTPEEDPTGDNLETAGLTEDDAGFEEDVGAAAEETADAEVE